jgi:hypothetical protein
VGSADADVVESAVDAEGDDPVVADAVVSEAVVGVGVPAGGRSGFGQAGVDRVRGRSMGYGPVWAVLVVDLHELLQQQSQLLNGSGLDGLGAEPVLRGLLDAFDLAAGGGMVRAGVLLHDVEAA